MNPCFMYETIRFGGLEGSYWRRFSVSRGARGAQSTTFGLLIKRRSYFRVLTMDRDLKPQEVYKPLGLNDVPLFHRTIWSYSVILCNNLLSGIEPFWSLFSFLS